MLPLKPPVSKKNLKDIKFLIYPIYDENGKIFDESSWPKYQGIFNGRIIVVNDSNDISRLCNLGYFGQSGVFDKNTFVDYKTLLNQVFKQKKNWHAMELVPFEFPSNIENKKVEEIQVENDDENCQLIKEPSTSKKNLTADCTQKINLLKQNIQDHTLENCLANYIKEPNTNDNLVVDGTPTNWKDLKTNFNKELNKLLILSGCEQNVLYYLLLEEAFFLCYTLECLEIQGENGLVMNVQECWKQFNGLKKDFPYFYAAYHYYRSKEWVVKPGHQYGGDYVLYKLSPFYYHSSYVVVVSINGQNSELLSSWPMWFGCSRVIEAANKDLLICTVHGPPYEEGMPIDLTQYTVKDTIVRRWLPSQNRMKP